MYFCISVSGAPPAPAVVPPGGAVLGARSLKYRNTEIYSMTKLFSKHTNIVHDDNDDNGP